MTVALHAHASTPPTAAPPSCSPAHIVTTRSAIDNLKGDLQRQQAKRIALGRLVVHQEVESVAAGTLLQEKAQQNNLASPAIRGNRRSANTLLSPSQAPYATGKALSLLAPPFNLIHKSNNQNHTCSNPKSLTSESDVVVDEALGTQDGYVDTARCAGDAGNAVEGSPVVGVAIFLLLPPDETGTPENGERINADTVFEYQSARAQAVSAGTVDEEDARATRPRAWFKALKSWRHQPDHNRLTTSFYSTTITLPSANATTFFTKPLSLPHQPISALSQLSLPISVPPPQPLLDQLTNTQNCYDRSRRAFHACHSALAGPEASLLLLLHRLVTPTSMMPISGDYSSLSSSVMPNDARNAIVQIFGGSREDTRVEPPHDEASGDNAHVGSLADVEAQITNTIKSLGRKVLMPDFTFASTGPWIGLRQPTTTFYYSKR
ncbi:hypothetical protein D9756_010164 [Leucocoprinus leucothites]|uniref:Uncharacterized protein n=1 Tax=Leucocoprinus leucothites TaxID=201217 RepID=A0A8H5CU54_9AGAR|nr:hypothetical protein D9756_010164 [Leucoagaricus leucothites]